MYEEIGFENLSSFVQKQKQIWNHSKTITN
jgi:hypothetical protein